MTEKELRQLMLMPEGLVDFKSGIEDMRVIAKYCVGIGNAGGGYLVMGVSDRLPRAIIPMKAPSERQLSKIRESVMDATGIRVSVETVDTSDGPVVVVAIPTRPRGVYFGTKTGEYLTRMGESLRGLTIPEMDAIRSEAGVELTASSISARVEEVISPIAMEELRGLMKESGASADLGALSDKDLLRSLGVLAKDGTLTRAALLLAGTTDALSEHVPYARWQFRRMKSDTEYDQAEDGIACVPIALKRLRELVGANNPIITIPGWLVHPEFPRYPVLALRELLVNALVHRDYAVPGAVVVKLYPDRLEISNPGGFVGGVSPDNILHHPPSPRYPMLVNALTRMRLANAANLGVPRVFRELLSEGKEPPVYWCSGSAVRVTVRGHETRLEFLELMERNAGLDVDHLLILHYLTRHREVSTTTAAKITQRPVEDSREALAVLVTRWGLLESGGGTGRGRYYRLSRKSYEALVGTLAYEVDRRLTGENAKARVIAVLRKR